MSGIQERYARALVSSHLEHSSHKEGAIDVLGAAGMAGAIEPRGAVFARLRREFDETHAAVKREAPEAGAINHRFVAVLKLHSLKAGKAAAGEMAETVCRRERLVFAVDALPGLVWQAISVWLDPTCGHCAGRGKSGGYDGPALRCTHCRGVGRRNGNTGKSDDERLFIDALAMELAAEMGRFFGRADARLRDAV